jgi:hypothetical protein
MGNFSQRPGIFHTKTSSASGGLPIQLGSLHLELAQIDVIVVLLIWCAASSQ